MRFCVQPPPRTPNSHSHLNVELVLFIPSIDVMLPWRFSVISPLSVENNLTPPLTIEYNKPTINTVKNAPPPLLLLAITFVTLPELARQPNSR